MGTAVEGVTAAGHVPTWIIQDAAIATDPTGDGPWSIPLSALTDTTTVQIDCHMDAGDVTVTRSPTTTTKQRMCEKVSRNVKTGETIDATVAGVYDQQALMTAAVNEAYSSLPEGSVVYIAQAFGWDSDLAPTNATVIDLVKAEVQTRMKTQPTAPDEDLKFSATLACSGLWADVTLSGTPPLWTASTAYSVGDQVTLTGGAVLQATVAGTSGTTEPTAPASVGGTVVDGGVTWERVS